MVTVAADGEHADESKCSLSFGQRMQAVRTRASTTASMAPAAETEEETARALAAARRELSAMEANGYAAKFGKDVPALEVASYMCLYPLPCQPSTCLYPLPGGELQGERAAARAARARRGRRPRGSMVKVAIFVGHSWPLGSLQTASEGLGLAC